MEQLSKFEESSIVYVDESGIDSFLSYNHGWSKRGEVIYGEVSGKRFARESFVAAKCGKKILAPFCYQGTCNSTLFNIWLEKILIPELKPRQILVLDNATFHKSEKTRILIENAGCELIFLPPYSPDLNPIEKFWAHLKNEIRKTVNCFKTLQDSIDHAFLNYTFEGL